MDPARKRTVRLVVALSAAVLLASALVYTSFSASSEARSPSQLLTAAEPGKTYQLTGKVVAGYERSGREVIVDVRKEGGVFVGEKDSLVTKCPSKFTAEKT